MKEELPDQLEKAIRTVTDLREQVEAGELTDGPVEIHERLLKARHAQDRAEAVVASLQRMYSQQQRIVAARKAELDDAEATMVGTLRIDDFSTAKERNSHLTLATVEQLLHLRRAERAAAEVKEALDYCQMLHRGIDSTRRDFELRTRLMSLQGQLDR